MAGLSALNFGSLGSSGSSMGSFLSGLVGSSSNPVLQPKGFNGTDLSAFQNFFSGNTTPASASNPSFPSNINVNGLNQQSANGAFNPNFNQMGQMMPNMGNNSVFAPNDPGFDGTIYPPEQAFAFMDQFFARQYPPIWQSSQMMMNNGMSTMQNGMQQGNWNTGMQLNNAPVNNQFGYNQFANTGYPPSTLGFGATNFGGFDPNAMYGGYNQGFDPNAMVAGMNTGYGQPSYPAPQDNSADMMGMIGALQGMLASLGSAQQQPPAAPVPPRTGGVKPPKPPSPPPVVVAAAPPPAAPAGGDDAGILALLQGLGLT